MICHAFVFIYCSINVRCRAIIQNPINVHLRFWKVELLLISWKIHIYCDRIIMQDRVIIALGLHLRTGGDERPVKTNGFGVDWVQTANLSIKKDKVVQPQSFNKFFAKRQAAGWQPHQLSQVTSVKVRWIPPKILMDHLIGCCYAAVALECSAKAYLMVDFWSGYNPMNMLFCNTHPDSLCNRWTPHKNTGKTFKNADLLLNVIWLYSDTQAR